MPRFFEENPGPGPFLLEGENGRHAVKSLRMQVGEALTLCDGKGMDYPGVVTAVLGETAALNLEVGRPSSSESKVRVHLFQCLPKSDKMELIIQKSVELGVYSITPVVSSRCIASLGGKEEKKLERWGKIALEAAKQSGRGIIPKVLPPLALTMAMEQAPGRTLFFYEGGGQSLKSLLTDKVAEISIFIGPEGGFSPEEAQGALKAGLTPATLGPRILRTETAPLCALSIILHELENSV